MNTPPCIVHVFRSDQFSVSGNTVVSVAPAERVIAVYGGGDAFGVGGLSAAFGGAIVFRNEKSGEYLFGVWGTRNASRFRSALRAHMEIEIEDGMPDARVVLWQAAEQRPKR